MSVTLEFAQIAWIVGGACGACGTIFGFLGKLLLSQTEGRLADRFKGLEAALSDNKDEWERIDKELVALRLNLAENYVKNAALAKLEETISRGFENIYTKLDTKASRDDLDKLAAKK